MRRSRAAVRRSVRRRNVDGWRYLLATIGLGLWAWALWMGDVAGEVCRTLDQLPGAGR